MWTTLSMKGTEWVAMAQVTSPSFQWCLGLFVIWLSFIYLIIIMNLQRFINSAWFRYLFLLLFSMLKWSPHWQVLALSSWLFCPFSIGIVFLLLNISSPRFIFKFPTTDLESAILQRSHYSLGGRTVLRSYNLSTEIEMIGELDHDMCSGHAKILCTVPKHFL